MKKNFNFQLLVEQRRSQKIKRKPKKPPVWLFPRNQEKQYDVILYSLVDDLKKLIREFLIPEIPSMIKEVGVNTPNDRNDNYSTRLKSLILYIREAIQGKVKVSIEGSRIVGFEIAKFNKRQADKLNESIFGLDLFVDEPWLADQLTLFADQNAQLIRSIPEEELQRVSGTVERGLQQGLRFTDIAKEIQKSFGVSHRKATLIARERY